MNIIFDWDGTIAKLDVAKEAARRRFKTLGQTIDDKWLANAIKTNDHYAVNKKLISEYTGIIDDALLTAIMTDIFRFHYIAVVHEWKDKALYTGMANVIKKLSEKHTLVIASTLREDILEYSLINLGLDKCFSKICANTPDLKYSKEQLVKMAKKYLKNADCVIGDKEEDIDAAAKIRSKSIYVTWGVTRSEHINKADYVADKPKDIIKIVENML